jgi:hypothetical protein
MDELRMELVEWRQEQWWLTDEYIRVYEGRIPKEQINSAIDAVARVFNKKWAMSVDAHPVCFYLLSKGTDPLQFLISLGRNILAVQESKGFGRVQKDLRDSGSYASARLELSLGALLRDAGQEIEFRPKLANGRESDIVARSNGQEVFVEVKILRESQVTEALSEFTTWLGRIVDESARSLGSPIAEMHYEVDLEIGLADTFGAGLKADLRFVNGFAEQTRTQILDNMRRGNFDFFIHDLGSFAFRPKEMLPNSTIIHRPVSPNVELFRILRSRFHGAIEQLPQDHPGLLVFRTAGNLEEDRARSVIEGFLREEAGGASHISAVIIFPVFYSLPSRWSPFDGFAVENPSARFPASSLQAFRTIVDECTLIRNSAKER